MLRLQYFYFVLEEFDNLIITLVIDFFFSLSVVHLICRETS